MLIVQDSKLLTGWGREADLISPGQSPGKLLESKLLELSPDSKRESPNVSKEKTKWPKLADGSMLE